MFSPASRKSHLAAQKGRILGNEAPASPATPLADDWRPLSGASVIPNRPITGTPAPWSSRLSVLARIPTVKKTEKGVDGDQIQPVYVGEFPQVVRSAQTNLLQKSVADNTVLVGGMDRGTSLSWIICGSQLYVWNYLSAAVSKKCVALEIPSSVLETREFGKKFMHGNRWMVCIVSWDIPSTSSEKMLGQCNSAALVLCNQVSQAVIYWPDIYSEHVNSPIVSFQTCSQSEESDLLGDGRFNSIIVSALPGKPLECVAVACQSNGVLWLFQFTSSGIHRRIISEKVLGGTSLRHSQMDENYARSVIWRSQHAFSEESGRQFFLLTNREIQCWSIMLAPGINVKKLWTHEIVGDDDELGIKKDLAGQKNVWLLDMQVDDRGKEISILVATFCKDRVSSSSYMQYSLLTMHYKPGQDFSSEKTQSSGLVNERILEKKAPLQVVIPKARVENEDFLFSMRLRVGGKPPGSALVLSGDGTATVTCYRRGSTRLYQFDLPWDAGKVLDASVFPSAEDSDEGSWIVLTEKAGIWAIPEKAVLLGGVEPPERSLSRKGSSNERSGEETRSQTFGGNIVPRRASSETWSAGDRQKAALTGIAQRPAQDDEADSLLGHLFHDFILTGGVEGALEKLRQKGAFEKDGETNVFARLSKSIVDTLAKHWTTTRGAEFVASAVVSSQLADKQQKHQKYLHFLALSKCHEELSSKQRHSLLIIMEHGEKLSGMIQLRELQNMLSQSGSNTVNAPSYSHSQATGSLWNLIQLVGEKARRNTVLLMDRDNSEVFYSRVSEIEDLFYSLSHHLQYVIGGEQTFIIQMQRACEVSNACRTLLQAALRYREEHSNWYPSPESLTPWNCQPVVRAGLWNIASFIMQLSKEAVAIDISMKSELWSQLEGLTDVLLDSYAGAVTAKIERGEEHKGLVDEYCTRKDELLVSLYELAKRLIEAKYQESYNGIEDIELKEAIFRENTSSVLSIAKRHEGYQTLWQICCDLGDAALLRKLMHDSVGPKGGFSYFVFRQLSNNRQYAKLLRLGEEFRDELASFLKGRKDLLWLHEIYLNEFSSASETLHGLALSADDALVFVNEEEQKLAQTKKALSLADRRRLLYLSKIAAVAGKDVGFEMKTGRIEADLQIMKLQEEIVKCFTDAGEMQDTDKPLPPGELIEMCLNSGDRGLSLKAFEVFAWTSSSFRSSNRSLLEECWRNAADQDDWIVLCQASTAEGWSDEVVLEHMRETVLFKASNLCYGPEAETSEGGFEEVLPLQKEDVPVPYSKDASPSVEGILMQHKDFPDAGKLMLTAIMMGKAGVSGTAEEDLVMEFQ